MNESYLRGHRIGYIEKQAGADEAIQALPRKLTPEQKAMGYSARTRIDRQLEQALLEAQAHPTYSTEQDIKRIEQGWTKDRQRARPEEDVETARHYAGLVGSELRASRENAPYQWQRPEHGPGASLVARLGIPEDPGGITDPTLIHAGVVGAAGEMAGKELPFAVRRPGVTVALGALAGVLGGGLAGGLVGYGAGGSDDKEKRGGAIAGALLGASAGGIAGPLLAGSHVKSRANELRKTLARVKAHSIAKARLRELALAEGEDVSAFEGSSTVGRRSALLAMLAGTDPQDVIYQVADDAGRRSNNENVNRIMSGQLHGLASKQAR